MFLVQVTILRPHAFVQLDHRVARLLEDGPMLGIARCGDRFNNGFNVVVKIVKVEFWIVLKSSSHELLFDFSPG